MQYRYEGTVVEDLSTDLREEAAKAGGEVVAVRITLYRDDCSLPYAEVAKGLWVPQAGRMGIAWGADADWVDAQSVEQGISRWLAGEDVL